MANLPPKPGDSLPPRPTRGATSPRAASMRDDPPREREWEREDRRRRASPPLRRFSPPRNDSWRRPSWDDDRYQDQTSRKRDDMDRDPRRSRGGRDRSTVDTYVPDSRTPPRRRSPPAHARRRHSRSRSPRPSERIASPRRPPRSSSPRRRPRSPPHTRRPLSRERQKPRSERSNSPHPTPRRRSHDHPQNDHRSERRASRSKSRALSEARDQVVDPKTVRRREKSRSRSKSKEPPEDGPPHGTQDAEQRSRHDSISDIKPPVLTKQLPVHPPPSGPRRPRTPTGPRARSPVRSRRDSVDQDFLRREEKGKGKEIPREEGLDEDKPKREWSVSPPRGPRKRTRRSWSRSPSRSLSRSPHSRSPRSISRSPSRSRSHRTHSDRASSHVPTGPKGDRGPASRDKDGRIVLNFDDLVPLTVNPRPSKTPDLDAQLKVIQEQRAKLEKEHVNVMRGVRRAQHELDLAWLEQKSAEERRKAAQRVHERTSQGFLGPVA